MLAEGTRSDHYQAGFDLTYSWNYYTALKNVWASASSQTLTTAHQAEITAIPNGKGKVRFTTNHDQSAWEASPMTLFNGKNGAIAASVANLFSGGTPLLYTGQEVGKTGTTPFFSNSTINWSANADMLEAYQKIYSIYNNYPAARSNNFSIYQLSNDLICWKKVNGSSTLLILINVRNSSISVTLPPVLTGELKNLITNQIESVSSSFTLAPYNYRIYQMN